MMGRRDERERVPPLLPSSPLSLFLPHPPHLFFISFLASLWLDSADRQTDGLPTTGKPAKNGLEFTASELRRETFFLECVCIDCHVDSAWSRLVTCPLLRPRASLRGWFCVVGGPERDTWLRGSSPWREGGGLNVELTQSSTYTPQHVHRVAVSLSIDSGNKPTFLKWFRVPNPPLSPLVYYSPYETNSCCVNLEFAWILAKGKFGATSSLSSQISDIAYGCEALRGSCGP